jgi:hypothetical protein
LVASRSDVLEQWLYLSTCDDRRWRYCQLAARKNAEIKKQWRSANQQPRYYASS